MASVGTKPAINIGMSASPLTSIISPHHHHPTDKHATIGMATKAVDLGLSTNPSRNQHHHHHHAASGDHHVTSKPKTVSDGHRPKTGEPFGNYVLRVLQPAPGVFTDLVAASACLYLFRSDPHELKSLANYWASLKRHELEGIKSSMLTRGLSSTSLFSGGDEEATTPRNSITIQPAAPRRGDSGCTKAAACTLDVMASISDIGRTSSQQGEIDIDEQHHRIDSKECIKMATNSKPEPSAAAIFRKALSPTSVTACLSSCEQPFTPITNDCDTNTTHNTVNRAADDQVVASMDLRAVINIGSTAGFEESEKNQQSKMISPSRRGRNESQTEFKRTASLDHEVEAAPGVSPVTPTQQEGGADNSTTCDPFLIASSGSAVFSPNSSQHMSPQCCLEAKLTHEQLVEHFLSTLQCCILSYFAYNWNAVEGTMKVNQEHKTYVERELIPRLERRRRASISNGDITPAELATPSYKDLQPLSASAAASPISLYSRATSEVASSTNTGPGAYPNQFTFSDNNTSASKSSTAQTISTNSARFPSQPSSRGTTRTFSKEKGRKGPLGEERAMPHFGRANTTTSHVDTDDEEDATPAMTPQGNEFGQALGSALQRHRHPPQIMEASTVHAGTTASPFAIPTDIKWATAQNISRLRSDAADTGLLLVFHAAFSMPSCQTLVDLDNLFRKELSSEEAAKAAWEEIKARRKLPVCNPASSFTSLSTAATPAESGGDRDYPASGSGKSLYTPIDSLASVSTTTSMVFPTYSFGYCVSEPDSFVPPKWAAVNAPTEPTLYSAYKVSWFPTIVFIPPVDAHADAFLTATAPSSANTDQTVPGPASTLLNTTVGTAAPSLCDSPDCKEQEHEEAKLLHEVPQSALMPINLQSLATRARNIARTMKATTDHHITYPEKGIRQPRYLLEWLLRRGDGGAYEKRVKSTITSFAVLAKQLQFASQRRQISGALALKKRQIHDPNPPQHNKEEPPMFVIIGGGMAAGKTTAATALAQSPWWQKYGNNAVIIDADEFKYNDPLFKSNSPDLHKKSLEAAEELLIDALNEGRDIVLDGTMSWLPYVQQTFEMVRDSHQYYYRRSEVGYSPSEKLEEYWERASERQAPLSAPYFIKFVGITVDPAQAVQRGILRRINTGRSVPLKAQLRSFRLFSQGFKQYCDWADNAILYNNNVRVDLSAGQLPSIIAEKPKGGSLIILDTAAFKDFLRHSHINQDATSEEDMWVEHRVRPDWELEAMGRKPCLIGGPRPSLTVEEQFRYSSRREGEDIPTAYEDPSTHGPVVKDDITLEGIAQDSSELQSPMSLLSPQDTMRPFSPPTSGKQDESVGGMPKVITGNISAADDSHPPAPTSSFASTAEHHSASEVRIPPHPSLLVKPPHYEITLINSTASSPILDHRQKTAAFAEK